MKKNIAVLDIETGGFSKTKNGLCEIAFLVIDESGEILKEFQTLIKPYNRRDDVDGGALVSYKDDAMAIHGITMEELELDGVDADEVGMMILEIFSDFNVDTILGHNVKSFDKRWVEEFMDRFGGGFVFENVIDTLHLAVEKFGKGGNKLPELCKRFGVENVAEHRALGDCNATLSVWKNLIEL